MSDLVVFLRARYDEDEKQARDLLADAQTTSLTLQEPKLLGKYIPGWHDWPCVERMCAARLAEVDAKRRIMERAAAEIESQDPPRASAVFASGVLLLLALPYASHPDYQQEWRL